MVTVVALTLAGLNWLSDPVLAETASARSAIPGVLDGAWISDGFSTLVKPSLILFADSDSLDVSILAETSAATVSVSLVTALSAILSLVFGS